MTGVTVHQMAQRTPEWYQIRAGRLTGSVAEDMMATIKSGEAAARRDLRILLATERLTGQAQIQDLSTVEWVQWGIENEAAALQAYESMTGNIVNKTGFLAHDALLVGCSLDGHVGDFDIVLSMKCPKSATHFRYLKEATIPKQYVPQMLHELWVTGAKEYHFMSFDPRFPWSLQRCLIIAQRNDDAISAYEDRALAFLAEVERDVQEMESLGGISGVLKKVLEEQ